jgi:DNA-binding SARP family transcriptional activator
MIHLHLLGPLELVDDAGHDVRPLLAQPKRLAVLAFLAAREAGEHVRRDTLLGLFWPDLDQEAARRSLRQALHVLRAQLGPDVVATRGDEEVAVNPAVLECDVAHFLAATGGARDVEALDWYRGDLLAGFYLTGGSAEFEQWLDAQRTQLRGAAAKAAAALVRGAEEAGDLGGATGWARRALALAPDDEIALRRLLRLLERSGDGAGAVRAYDTFARRLARELDHAPSAETQAMVARLRAAAGKPPLAPPAATSQLEPLAPAAPPPSAPHRWMAALAIGAAVLVLAGATTLVLNSRPEHPVLAVGDITDADAAMPEVAARILPQLLASDLAQVGGLSVLRPARVEEVAGRLAAAAGRPPSATEAARTAGATDLVEGVLYRLGHDSLRLDLRRVDVHSSVVRDAVSLEGVNAFALADSAAARFAGRFHLAPPSHPLIDVTSASLQAQVLYREGLKAFYRDQNDALAARLFSDAVAADSTFAMAAYYLSNALGTGAPERSREALALANRMAGHATAREALLIRAAWADERGDPAWPALAESLVDQYPVDPESRVLVGEARATAGDFTGAVAAYREAIHLDSVSLVGSGARCLACDAYGGLVGAYLAADSLPAAVAAAHAWVAVQPRSPRAWSTRALVLERAGRLDDALAARTKADQLLGTPSARLDLVRGYHAILAGDPAAAESLLAGPAADPRDPQRAEAGWWLLLALRTAGRPGAAIPLARRLAQDTAGRGYTEGSLAGLPLGQVLFEAGRLAEAGRLFDSAGFHSPAFRSAYPGQAEHDRVWALAQRATVAAAERDTIALARLADSVAAHARATPWGRDRHLPSYVRGLRLEVTGQLAAAADTFRQALFAPSEGYTRVNLELARTLLALGRPAEAVPVLQAALRGGLDASNFYVTRGELEDEAGDAFAALGRRDSAVAHYAWVARAWRYAEPAFQARWRAAADYVAGNAATR